MHSTVNGKLVTHGALPPRYVDNGKQVVWIPGLVETVNGKLVVNQPAPAVVGGRLVCAAAQPDDE